jgi:hypothetical protein
MKSKNKSNKIKTKNKLLLKINKIYLIKLNNQIKLQLTLTFYHKYILI